MGCARRALSQSGIATLTALGLIPGLWITHPVTIRRSNWRSGQAVIGNRIRELRYKAREMTQQRGLVADL